MDDGITIGVANTNEAAALYTLVERVADEMVCKDFNPGGPEEFYAAVRMLVYDRPEGHLLLSAKRGTVPVGMIDIRDNYHICLFFVDTHEQNKGIGRALFEETKRRIGGTAPPPFEVNASLYAVPIYERLGFVKTGGVQLKNGIRFVAMVLCGEQGGHRGPPPQQI